MDIKEYISRVRKMPQGFVPEGKMNNKEDEKFIRYFSKWLWAWVRNHVDKSFEEKPLWYRTIQDVTNSDSEAIRIIF